MKKMIALAVAAGFVVAANADVDVEISGQTALYYQTMDLGGDADLFDKGANSRANAGLQLNVKSELGNGFALGVQGTALGTLGLENNLVGASMQTAQTGDLNGASITQMHLTKKLGNTTFKAGRQELPKSLSPFAFTEGWNVFKNTFDSVLAINSSLPNTTLVGAYVSRSNGKLVKTPGLVDLGSFDTVGTDGAYMLTAANKSYANTPITVSYYQLPSTDLSVLWGDVKTKSGGLKLGLQGGTMFNGGAGKSDVSGVGVKVGGKVGIANLSLAYTNVGDGDGAIHNVGTGVKTPLYTQMILNQGHIKHDNDTVLLKGVMPAGGGKFIAQYGITSDNSPAGKDYNELDLIYKFKAFGTNMLAGYIMQDEDGKDANNVIRLVSRYNF